MEVINNKEKLVKKSNNFSEKKVSTKSLDTIITCVITLVFFLCPIFFTGLVAQGIGFEKIILFYFLTLIGIVAWVIKGAISGELNIKRTPLDIPILATVIIFTISTILSISNKDSLIGGYGTSAKSFIAVIAFILFYYLVINNINKKKIKLIFWSIIASTSILSIFSLLQLNNIFIIPLDFTKARGFNPLGSLSGLTMFLTGVFPLFVVAITRAKNIFFKSIIILASIINISVLVFLNGFVFWPVFVVGSVIVLMFFLAKIIKISTNNLIIPLGAFLISIIFLVLGNFNITNLNLPAEVSLSRSASWDIAKNSIRENPVFGSGPATFYYNFSKFKSLDFNYSRLWNVRFDSATGSFFELLSTVGILGTLLVIILILTILSISFLSLIKSDENNINSIMLGLFASFISLLLLSLLFAQSNSLILLTVLISIFTISVALIIYPEKFNVLKLSFRASPKYALALSAIFLCVSAGVVILFTMGLKMYLADIYIKQSLVETDFDKKIENLKKASNLATYQDTYYLNLANSYMALANKAAVSNKNKIDIGNNLSTAINYGKKAVEINPNKASNNESLALIYENASFYTRGSLKWSEEYYNKVIELDPKNPVPYLRIALINMARVNTETNKDEQKYYIEEAIKKYDESIAKKSDMSAAYYGKAVAYEKLSDTDNAIENLKNASLISRDNLDYRFELGRMYFNRGVSQPNLSQTKPQNIVEKDISPDRDNNATSTNDNKISVKQSKQAGDIIKKNSDLENAEQYFLSILTANKNHANAKYSLATLYKKIGDTKNVKIMVNSLLETLTDEKSKEAVKQQFKGMY